MECSYRVILTTPIYLYLKNKGIKLFALVTMLKMTPEIVQNMDIFLNFYANFLGVLENRL